MTLILRSIALSLAAALLLANAEPEDEGTICVTVAHLWWGDVEDVRRIHSTPVPDSFRRLFEAGGCTRFSLVEQSLVEWHQAFGDERTTALALAYLEADYRKGVPPPEAFGPHLAAAWGDARRTIAAAALPPPDDPKRDEREAPARKARSVRRALEAVGAWSRYVELAGAYARAAELYGSPGLLEKAELYFAPTEAGLATLFAGGAEPHANLDHIVYAPSHLLDEVLDLEMRIAILRARFDRAPADLDKAAAAVTRQYQPVFETAADNAREHSGNFCEIHGEAEGQPLQALRQACDKEPNLPRRTMNFWRNRATLDLLMAADPQQFETTPRNLHTTGSEFVRRTSPAPDAEPARRIRAFDTAIWLLRNRRLGDGDGRSPRFDGAEVDLFSLLLARAEMHARRRPDDAEETGLALDYAAQAARLAPPHVAPALFRRAAQAWLELWTRARETKSAGYWPNAERGRFAAYLRTNLDSLDSIALGEAGDPASRRQP